MQASTVKDNCKAVHHLTVWSYSQTPTSVLTTMVAVHRPVPTVLEATHVPAVLGTPSMLMAMLAMVCLIVKKYINYIHSQHYLPQIMMSVCSILTCATISVSIPLGTTHVTAMLATC